MPDFEQEGGTTVGDKHETKNPRKFVAIIHNDDFTPMDFVVHVLMSFFEKSLFEAGPLMLQVHQQGSAIAGVYTREIAETKIAQATSAAKEHGHPLRLTMQPE